MSDETEESGSRVLSFLRALFIRNFHLKSIALLLTLALYLWVGEDRETQVIATAPIQISVPEDQILLQPNIDLLESHGVNRISVAAECTACNCSLGSFRREGAERFTRMLAVIQGE